MSWPGLRASSADFALLRQLSTDAGSNDDDGGGNKLDARRTSRMKAPHSSHSTDTVDNTHTDNSHIRSRGSHSRTQPGTQIRFRPTRQRQNAVRERKPIPLPPIQLREVFSSSLFFLLPIKPEIEVKVFRFIRMEEPRDTP